MPTARPDRSGASLLRRLAPGSLLGLAVMAAAAPAQPFSETLAGLVGLTDRPVVRTSIAGGVLEFAARPPLPLPSVAITPAPMSASPGFALQSYRFLTSSCDPPIAGANS